MSVKQSQQNMSTTTAYTQVKHGIVNTSTVSEANSINDTLTCDVHGGGVEVSCADEDGSKCNKARTEVCLFIDVDPSQNVYLADMFLEFNQPIFKCKCAVLGSHVVRPSVCPSVTLVYCDHIDCKTGKLITRTTSPTPSLFVAKR